MKFLAVFLAISLLSCASPQQHLYEAANKLRPGYTKQGVHVVQGAVKVLTVAQVEYAVSATISGGLCKPHQFKDVSIVLILTTWFERSPSGLIIGQTFPLDKMILVASLSSLFTTAEPQGVIVHELAHICRGDGAHENAVIWDLVKKINVANGWDK